MRFPSPLIPATLLRRYKRFLADVVLPSYRTRKVTVMAFRSEAEIAATKAQAVQ